MKKRHITELSMEERATLFASAGRAAVERSKALGLPTTGLRGNKIVKTYPDGREEVIKVLDSRDEKVKVSA
jgi:hypothetical protein